MIVKLTARRHLAALVLGVALLAPCVAVLQGHYLLDLDVYRAGGRHLFSGGLYSFRIRQYGFTYPPFAAVLFAPLSWLSLGAASWVMTLLSATCLVVFVGLSAPRLARQATLNPTIAGVGALAALTACQPVVSTLWNGQVNLVLGALVLVDVLVWRRGVLVGVAAAVKLTPAIFVLYLLACGRRREARTAAVTFVGIAASMSVVLPGPSWRYATRVLISGSGIGDLARPGNQSIRGLLLRLVGPHAALMIWAALVLPTVIGGLLLARSAVEDGREPYALGIVGVTGCLISPLSWTHHWIWCVPWVAGLVGTAMGRGWLSIVRVCVLAAVFCTQGRGLPALIDRGGELWRIAGNGFVVVAAALGGYALLARGRTCRRCLHSPGASARLDLALVYGECQPVNGEVRTADRPSRALSTGPRTDISK